MDLEAMKGRLKNEMEKIKVHDRLHGTTTCLPSVLCAQIKSTQAHAMAIWKNISNQQASSRYSSHFVSSPSVWKNI